jgi:hypothetical protein
MACTRSFPALPGLFCLLLGILTIVRASPPGPYQYRRPVRSFLHPRSLPRQLPVDAWAGTSSYQQLGTSGVAAMQLSVVDDRYVILFDKAEHNPLTTSDGINAWSALLDTQEHTVRALKLATNTFCAGKLCPYQRHRYLVTI